MGVYYQTDNSEHKKYMFSIPTKKFGNIIDAIMVLRFIEFWAQTNCQDSWKAEITDANLLFSTSSHIDAISFHISKIYEKTNLTLVRN